MLGSIIYDITEDNDGNYIIVGTFTNYKSQNVNGIVKEASGVGNDGAYLGLIFDKAIPLVSNGIYGTRLLD